MTDVHADGPPRTGAVSVASLAAVLVATLSFLPIVQGGSWWWESLLFAGVAVAVAAGARRIGAPAGAAALLALATIPLVAVLTSGGGRGLLVVLPTRDAALSVLAAMQTAFQQVQSDTTPAADTPGLALVIGAGVAVAAVLVDVVAVGLRAPIAAMLVVLALAVVPGRALNTGTSGWLLVAVAIAVLVVVAADRRRRGAPSRLGGLLAGGAAAVVLALAAQVVLPAPFAQQAAGSALPPLFSTGADTLLRLGDDLRRGADTPVLTYTTTGSDDVYLRLAVLEDFSGSTWTPNAANSYPLSRGAAPSAPGLSTAAVRGSATTVVTPSSSSSIGERLPITYPAATVAGAVGSGFRWEREGLTLQRAQSGDAVGTYTVTSTDVDTSASVLRRASTSVPDGDQASLTLPADVPSIIVRTARAWTSGATTDYAKALAIQNRLRNGAFYYDEQTPVQQGYDGDGLGVIAKFLTVKGGYCIHFASTMAVMARLEGIPSRIVVGYQPGTVAQQDGKRVYTVSTDDLHAWPELYFDGVGWVRFEPTPGRGAVPSYAPAPAASSSVAANVNPRVSAVPSSQPSASAAAAAAAAARDPRVAVPLALRAIARVLGVAALVVLLLAVPGAIRALLRRRRLARVARTGDAELAWREAAADATDFGIAVPARASPRAVEAALATAVDPSPAGRAALQRIRAAYERQAYAPDRGTASAADVREVRAAFAASASRVSRVLATIAPRSLVGTMTPSRLAFGWSPSGSDRRLRIDRLGAHR